MMNGSKFILNVLTDEEKDKLHDASIHILGKKGESQHNSKGLWTMEKADGRTRVSSIGSRNWKGLKEISEQVKIGMGGNSLLFGLTENKVLYISPIFIVVLKNND